MLGHLARWLRLLGFDATYAGSVFGDDEILLQMAQENRVLATKDALLHQRAARRGCASVLVAGATHEEELVSVLDQSHARIRPEACFTRCTTCNGVLEPLAKEMAEGHVPPGVWDTYEAFQRCPGCGQIYWEGSHVDAIAKRVLALAARLRRD